MKPCYSQPIFHHLAVLDVSPAPDLGGFYINRINVPDGFRNHKTGTTLMRQVCKDADAEGVTLFVHPTTNYGSDLPRLQKFFRRFDFYPVEGSSLYRRDPWVNGHSKQCHEDNEAYLRQVEAFKKEHPNYCTTCGGWGGHTSPGCSVPYGSTSVSLPDEFDVCPDCVEKGICPICGKEAFDEDGTECSECGWDWDGKINGLPEPPGCGCFFNDDFF